MTAEGQKIAIDAPNRLVETEDGGAELQDSQGRGVFKISPEQRQYQERLKSYYERGDQEAFDELQAFGEQRSQQLNTESTGGRRGLPCADRLAPVQPASAGNAGDDSPRQRRLLPPPLPGSP